MSTVFEFPKIDYRHHPYYERLWAETTDGQRRATLGRFYKVFSGIVAQQAEGQKYIIKRPLMDTLTAQQKQFSRDGIVALSIRQRDMDELRMLIRSFEQELAEKRSRKAPEKRAVGAASLEICNAETPSAEYDHFVKLMTDYDVFERCRLHKGYPYTLEFVYLQHNTHEDGGLNSICSFEDGTRAASFYTHFDSAVDRMKVILYVSEDVTPEGGAFRFIPGSHKAGSLVERAIRKANDKCGWENVAKVEDRAAFISLPPDLQMKANFGNDLLDRESAACVTEQEIAYDSSKGNCVLFDPEGIHRGAIFTRPAERKILQFRFIPTVLREKFPS